MEGQELSEWAGRHGACQPTGHCVKLIYDRPWKQAWMRRYHLVCTRCRLHIEEPLWLDQSNPQLSSLVTIERGGI